VRGRDHQRTTSGEKQKYLHAALLDGLRDAGSAANAGETHFVLRRFEACMRP
jgi:hypothetical protein